MRTGVPAAQLLTRLTAETAPRVQAVAIARNLDRVNERDHLAKSFRETLIEELPGTGYRPARAGERRCEFVWVELKCDCDRKWALAACGWDAARAPSDHDDQPPRPDWLFEVHPELSFAAMSAGTVLPPKPAAHGQLLRLDLVRGQFPDAEERIRAWEGGSHHSLLDVCDAYAACWTALRFAQTCFGVPSQRDRVTPPLEVLGEDITGGPGCGAADADGGVRPDSGRAREPSRAKQ